MRLRNRSCSLGVSFSGFVGGEIVGDLSGGKEEGFCVRYGFQVELMFLLVNEWSISKS